MATNKLSHYFQPNDSIYAIHPLHKAEGVEKFRVHHTDDAEQKLYVLPEAFPNVEPQPYTLKYHLYRHTENASEDPDNQDPTYTPEWCGIWGTFYDKPLGFVTHPV